MPKVKGKAENRMRKYVAEFSNVSSTDGTVLFCQPCGKSIVAEQRQVTQYLTSNKHVGKLSTYEGQANIRLCFQAYQLKYSFQVFHILCRLVSGFCFC
ncbi:unnamed protein product [Lasius platythorax]|uniref:Uncharacterized protein n=1 Tax=Lasius platythorax TaxID=488582 RepID=A0AAV2NCY1_9HYME